MPRSDFLIKLMSAILFIAIAAYIGLYIFNAAEKELVTAPAVRYTEKERGEADGYIVRSETLLTGGHGTVTLLADEGEKVASGQAVAVYYEGESAVERASEIRALQLEIRGAEAARDATAALRTLDTNACVIALSDAVRHGSFDDLQDLEYSVRLRVFAGASESISDGDLAVLKDRLELLLSESGGTMTLYAPRSGLFSTAADGYESVSPDSLTALTPSSLAALFGAPGPETGALGKLITGINWYYAAVMDASDAAKLEVKGTAALQFTKTYNRQMDMTVESVGPEENGRCVVVFSSGRGMSDTTVLRALTAEVEFGSLTGLLVPKAAVYIDADGRKYTYLLTVLQAERVYIEIIGENGDDYIVRDGAENNTVLREGSEIIVRADDLYDGKVVAG